MLEWVFVILESSKVHKGLERRSLRWSKTQQNSENKFLIYPPQQLTTLSVLGKAQYMEMLSKQSQPLWPYTGLAWKGHFHLWIGFKVTTEFFCLSSWGCWKKQSSWGVSRELLVPPKNLQKSTRFVCCHLKTSFPCLVASSETLLWPPRHDFLSPDFRSCALSSRWCQFPIPRLVIFRESAPAL